MQLSSLVVQGTGIIGLSQQTLQAQQHCLHVVRSTPLVLQDVQANTTAEIDVGMIDGCFEEDRGGRVWVVGGELEAEFEAEISVRCVFGPDDGSNPV